MQERAYVEVHMTVKLRKARVMGKCRKIGIMGGTFDPIHIGHLMIAQQACDQFALDQVLFLPSGDPPHKNASQVTGKAHRGAMVEQAIQDNWKFVLCRTELDRSGKSYTIDTLRELKRHAKDEDVELFYIIGADVLFDLETWKDCRQVFQLCSFLIFGRSGYTPSEMKDKIAMYAAQYQAKMFLFDVPNMEVSSTFLRACISKGRSVKYYMPDDVITYIWRHRLYMPETGEIQSKDVTLYADEEIRSVATVLYADGEAQSEDTVLCIDEKIQSKDTALYIDGKMQSEDAALYTDGEIQSVGTALYTDAVLHGFSNKEYVQIAQLKLLLKDVLQSERDDHCVQVMYTANVLAELYAPNLRWKATLAGLLHDYAKEMTVDEMQRVLKKHDVKQRGSVHTWHGQAAAYILKEKFDWFDNEMMDAVYYHTIGRANMGMLEKIVYVADKIEPSNYFDGIEEIRHAAKTDLTLALILLLNRSIIRVARKKEFLDVLTLEARNYYLPAVQYER